MSVCVAIFNKDHSVRRQPTRYRRQYDICYYSMPIRDKIVLMLGYVRLCSNMGPTLGLNSHEASIYKGI